MTEDRDNWYPLRILFGGILFFVFLAPVFVWPRSAWERVWYGNRSRRPWLMAAAPGLVLVIVLLDQIPPISKGFEYLLIDAFLYAPYWLGEALFVEDFFQTLPLIVFFPLQIALMLFVLSTFPAAPVHWALIWWADRKGTDGPSVRGFKLRSVAKDKHVKHRDEAQGLVYLGMSRSNGKPFYLSPEHRVMHSWVVGATGVGKTVSAVMPVLRADVLDGRPLLFIDGKGDRETLDELWSYVVQAGRQEDFRYLHLSDPQGSQTYSPLVHGTATEQKDKLISAFDWSEPHYKKRAEEVLLRILSAFVDVGQGYALKDVHAVLDDRADLDKLVRHTASEEIRKRLRRMRDEWDQIRRDTTGLRTDLGLVCESEFGRLFSQAEPDIDLLEAYQSGHIVYMGLPTLQYEETAVRLARIILQDLKTVAGVIQTQLPEGDRRLMGVVVDEFASFAFPQFAEFLSKARGAGMALLLSHQSLRGDLEKAGEAFFAQVVANTNVKLCMRQDNPADAEEFARIAGTYTTWKETVQVQDGLFGEVGTGMKSEREVEEFNISPNVIKQLRRGEAGLVLKHPSFWVDVMSLDYPQPKRRVAFR